MKTSQKGFTLIEVLVSIGIVGMATLIGLEIFKNSQEVLKLKEVSIGVESIRQTVRQKIRFAALCNSSLSFTGNFNFAQASTAAGQPISVKYEEDKGTVIAGNVNNIEGINILSFNITDLKTVDTSGLTHKHVGLLRLSAEKANTNLGGKQFAQEVIGAITIETDAANNYIGCYVEDSASPSTCTYLGGTYNPSSSSCSFSLSLGQCKNSNEYLVGFQNGSPVCQSFDGMCPANEYLVGISASGVICTN